MHIIATNALILLSAMLICSCTKKNVKDTDIKNIDTNAIVSKMAGLLLLGGERWAKHFLFASARVVNPRRKNTSVQHGLLKKT